MFAPLEGMTQLPFFRQIGLLLGFAASIALGVSIVFWAQTPDYRVLYSNLTDKDAAQIVEELQQNGIPYTMSDTTGAVMVPEKYMHNARMNLARVGLPKGGNPGIELLENVGPFGGSEFLESARYNHALEGELARSIQSISVVQSARVHLAIPKQSAFLRNRQSPSASVLVNLYPGHMLKDTQVAAIRNMVAAGVASMDIQRVTVIDQNGQLLTPRNEQQSFAMNREQFDYTQRLEETYISRIENLLTPIIGPGGVRAQVVLDMDYSVTEQAQESYNPETKIIRSEHIQEERNLSDDTLTTATGVPGAFSNQNPEVLPANEAIIDPDTNTSADTTGASAEVSDTFNSSLKTTRNYEIGKTISHTRAAPGKIRRLSVAVVVDDKQSLSEDGDIERTPFTEEELERMSTLVKEAVGFNPDRGDSVHLINTSFISLPEPSPLPDPSLLEQPWLWNAGKLLMSGIGFLLLLFGVLRPVMRNLAIAPKPENQLIEAMAMPENLNTGVVANTGMATAMRQGGNYEDELNTAKSIVAQDPKRVAQVVKNWVTSDA